MNITQVLEQSGCTVVNGVVDRWSCRNWSASMTSRWRVTSSWPARWTSSGSWHRVLAVWPGAVDRRPVPVPVPAAKRPALAGVGRRSRCSSLGTATTRSCTPPTTTQRPSCGSTPATICSSTATSTKWGCCTVLSRASCQGGGCKQEHGVTHRYIRDLLSYLLECSCVYLVHPKFDLYIFSNNSRQNSLLAVSLLSE